MVSAIPQARIRKSYPESTRGAMALPMILLRDKNQDLSHEHCLLAAFSHMAKLVEESNSGQWGLDWQSSWSDWNAGKFRKIVKRANPQRFTGLALDPQSFHTTILVGDELVELLSFPPYLLSDPDPRVKPLQVAGLECESRGSISTDANKPQTGLVLAYDESLGATTGKMMAQAAHGAQLLKFQEPGWKFGSEPIQVVNNFDLENVEWLVEVVDAGFTEVAPNSNTVRIGRIR